MHTAPLNPLDSSASSDRRSKVQAHLADLLARRREDIIAEWLRRLCSDSRIPSTDRLSRPALIDHVPLLLEGIIRLLRASGDAGLSHRVEEDAKDHGIQRLQQGYRLEELLTEFAQLRAVMIEEVLNIKADESTTLSPRELSLPLLAVQSFLDDLAGRSVQRYVEEQQLELKKVGDSRLQIMRTVSHELRNVLNSLGLAANLCEDPEPEDLQRLRDLLGRNVQHMKELLDDLLELSTLLSGKAVARFSHLEPASLLKEIVATYQPIAAEKGLHFFAQSDPRLLSVQGDALKLKQIAANLVSNAIKYTDAGQVSVEFHALDQERWSMRILDTGIGIEPSEHGEIFNELYRVEKSAHVPGVGLGLSIVSRLVDLCQARIEVESNVGQGSRFEVVLPRAFAS